MQTQQDFERKLTAIVDKAANDIFDLIQSVRNENGREIDDALFPDDGSFPTWERRADFLMETGAAIYDDVRGKRGKRGSMRRKIRKALGYTYP